MVNPSTAPKETANKKRKAETQETDSKRSTASATEKKAATPTAAEKKAEQAAKKQKTEKPAEKKKEAAEKPEQKSAKKQTLPSGLIIEDFKIGDGPVAKKGKRLGMR